VSEHESVSDEDLRARQLFEEAWQRHITEAPERRAERVAQAKLERAEVRRTTERAPLTLDAVIDKLGWSREYAEHFVQPYCECHDGWDGWVWCAHSSDVGLES
jgi:hypothetical protein